MIFMHQIFPKTYKFGHNKALSLENRTNVVIPRKSPWFRPSEHTAAVYGSYTNNTVTCEGKYCDLCGLNC